VPFRSSQAAYWQARQTQAFISAGLWAFLIKITLLGWLIATLAATWVQTGRYIPELHHAYFCRWALAGLIDCIPGLQNFLSSHAKVPLD